MTRLLAVSALVVSLVASPAARTASAMATPEPRDLLRNVAGQRHPYLLFHTIKETPGWRNRGRNPWQEWMQQASDPGRWSIEAAVEQLGMASNGMYSEERSGEQAMMWAFAHLLTNKSDFLEPAVTLLKQARQLAAARASKGGDGRVVGRLLIGFSLAYDWVQPDLSATDDQLIREQLAGLADAVWRAYPQWSNAHDRIIASSGLGIAALALAGYNGPAKSAPADWLEQATTSLFVNDVRFAWPAGLHVDLTRGRSALEGTLNPGGFNQAGSYSIYWMPQVIVWLAVYHHALARNPLDDFPITRRMIQVPLWESMPNRMDSEQGTREHQYYRWYRGISSMLTPEERGAFHWYGESTPADPMRELRSYATLGPILFFILNDDSLPRQTPSWTSFISSPAESVVLRSGWTWDGDWFFLKSMNLPGPSDRHMLHNDNMSFELYSRGNYLLSDGGEVKYRARGYGPQYACAHNSLLIDGVGPVKEDLSREAFDFVDPARLTNFALNPALEFAESEMRLTHVEYEPVWSSYENGERPHNAKPLDSPVTWRRTVLYPGKEYFLLIDDVQGNVKHSYEFLFHLSSLEIRATQGEEPGKVDPGHVIGDLLIAGNALDWAKDVKTDPLTVENPRRRLREYKGNSEIVWRTRNPQFRQVELRLASSIEAASAIVGRTWGRVAQMRTSPRYEASSMEVDHPFVSFQHFGTKVARITALLTRYADDEPERRATRVRLQGEGSALKLERGGTTDVVAAGRGPLAFEQALTDAEISLLRTRRDKLETALIIRGRLLERNGKPVIAADQIADHALLHFSDREITGHLNLAAATIITIQPSFTPKVVGYRPESDHSALLPGDKDNTPPRALPFKIEPGGVKIQCPRGAGEIIIF